MLAAKAGPEEWAEAAEALIATGQETGRRAFEIARDRLSWNAWSKGISAIIAEAVAERHLTAAA